MYGNQEDAGPRVFSRIKWRAVASSCVPESTAIPAASASPSWRRCGAMSVAMAVWVDISSRRGTFRTNWFGSSARRVRTCRVQARKQFAVL